MDSVVIRAALDNLQRDLEQARDARRQIDGTAADSSPTFEDPEGTLAFCLQRLYESLLTVLEIAGLPETRCRLVEKWQEFENAGETVKPSHRPDIDYVESRPLDHLETLISSLRASIGGREPLKLLHQYRESLGRQVRRLEKLPTTARVDTAFIADLKHEFDGIAEQFPNLVPSFSGTPSLQVETYRSRIDRVLANIETEIGDPQHKSVDTAPLERVLDNFVREAEESSAQVGKRVLADGAKTGLHGRLPLVAEKEVEPIHKRIVGEMVQQVARFAAKNNVPLPELFTVVQSKFDALHVVLLRPIEMTARRIFRSTDQQNTIAKQMTGARERLEQRSRSAQQLQELQGPPALEEGTEIAHPPALSRKVFVVHGHDEGAREKIARFLERLGFEPIILHEKASCGRTVIEKVEAHSDVGFAVVLLTADDEGRKKDSGTLRARARQNVILELGYFVGRLGRTHVCALKRGGDLEIPSDFEGVVYVPLDDADGWKQALGRELKAAGFEFDWSKAIS